MTIYTIISIVIALSGATFTAIMQFSSVLGERMRRLRKDSTDSLNEIASRLNDVGTQKRRARRRDRWMGFWLFIWNISSAPPVLVLLIFSFTVAIIVIRTMSNADSEKVTTDGVGFYHAWICWVIVVNGCSMVIKVISWLAMEIHNHLQTQCRQTLTEQNPVGQVVTPEANQIVSTRKLIPLPPLKPPPSPPP